MHPFTPSPPHPLTRQDVSNMQAALRECFEDLRPQLDAAGAGWRNFLWAVQALHSRCFYDPTMGLHLSVPGGVSWCRSSPCSHSCRRACCT